MDPRQRQERALQMALEPAPQAPSDANEVWIGEDFMLVELRVIWAERAARRATC